MEECGCSFADTAYLKGSEWCPANLTLFVSMMEILIGANCRIADPCRRASPDPGRLDDSPFDFIVVGAGVAGSVVGSRLSENGRWRVLLLEAGPEEPSVSGVPALATSAIGTPLDWGFTTQPSNRACLSTGGSCYWPRGKMVGGTGAMTGMMYIRGHREIFDDWARSGNVGWTYEECLEYFKKSENNENPELIDEGFHGTGGPLVVRQFGHHPRFAEYLLEAGRELGYRTGDLNGRNQTGFAIAQMTVKHGVRAGTSKMYLRGAYKRKNLVVGINSRVVKVLIDRVSKRAVGVKYYDAKGNLRTATAKKEVILSAGAVGSPHLLMLSGVGPAAHLAKHKIPLVQDLKVGRNLHNHVSVGVDFFVEDNETSPVSMETLKQYLDDGTGQLASTGLTQTTAFVHSKYSGRVADIQLFFDGFSGGCPPSECGAGEESCRRGRFRARPTNVLTRSKGYLTLKSADPFDDPLIVPEYLSDPRDVEVLIEGIKISLRLAETEALKKWKVKPDRRAAPLCERLEYGTDPYWECLIRSYTGPENHPAGTCKMGPIGDPDAVVDPELRVHGVINLRVIDASVFPYVPNSNPIASIVMVAEKGSHMIQSAWSSRRD